MSLVSYWAVIVVYNVHYVVNYVFGEVTEHWMLFITYIMSLVKLLSIDCYLSRTLCLRWSYWVLIVVYNVHYVVNYVFGEVTEHWMLFITSIMSLVKLLSIDCYLSRTLCLRWSYWVLIVVYNVNYVFGEVTEYLL
jgi:predicted membrane-bound dolichyl-phosphate-mannose-protein mannosyltransferase